MAHLFLMKQEVTPWCPTCQTQYMVKKFIIECIGLDSKRHNFFKVNNLNEILKNIKINRIIKILKSIELYLKNIFKMFISLNMNENKSALA